MGGIRDREIELYETQGFESPGFWDTRRDTRLPAGAPRDARGREALGSAFHKLGIERVAGPWVLGQENEVGLRPRQGNLVCKLPAAAQRNHFLPGDVILIGSEPEKTIIQLFPELGVLTRDTTANEICGMSLGFTGRKQARYEYGYVIEAIRPSDRDAEGGAIQLRGVLLFEDEEKRGAADWDPGYDAVLLQQSTQWTREQLAAACGMQSGETQPQTILIAEFIATFAPGADLAADQAKSTDPVAKADLGRPARLWTYLPGTRALGLRLNLALEKFLGGGIQDALLSYAEAFAADLVEKNVLEKIKKKGKVEQGDWLGSAQKAAGDMAKKLLEGLAGGSSGSQAVPGQDAIMELYANKESFTPEALAKIASALAANILMSVLSLGDKISSVIGSVVKEVAGTGKLAKTTGDKLGGVLSGQLSRIPKMVLDVIGGISTEPRK